MRKYITEFRLTERRKADRQAMAAEIIALGKRYNWQADICQHTAPGDVRVSLCGPRGLSVSIEFERHTTMPDHYCMPWHFTYTGDKDAKLSDNFGRFQGSPFDNHHHRRKCTAFASGIDTLLDKLEVAMQMANGTSEYGSAFIGGDNA